MEATELCPWCSSVISRDNFLEIEGKIRAQEKEKLDKREASIRQTLQQQFAADYEKQRQSSEKKFQAETEKTVAKLVAERDAAARKLKDAEGREVEIRKQAKAEAEKIATKELEKQKGVLDKLTAERDATAKKLKEAEAREADIRKQAKAEAEKASTKELQKQREILEKDRDAVVLKTQAEFNREREALQKKVKVMEQALLKKTANQLGDGAEIDLYEALRENFRYDHIERVPKGQNGADIIYDVMHKGQPCGRIVIDSKNHQSWKSIFVTKLRDDQVAAQAEHAILSSSAFPAGKKEMCIESNVIVISPARVIYVIELLRKAMIAMHIQGLSMQSKADKMSRLYKLMTSDRYTQRFGEATKLTDEILELDVDEQKTHSLVWKKRGSLARRMLNVLREIETDVASVIEGEGAAEVAISAHARLRPAVVPDGRKREAI